MTQSTGPAQWNCPEARIALGVYVLGAIDPAEQALVEDHLDDCDACQAEMAELADLMPLLALVPVEEAIQALEAGEAAGPAGAARRADSNAGRDSGNNVYSLSAARRRRQSLARITAVAAAAVVIGAASFGGVKLGSPRQDPHNVVGAATTWQTGHGSAAGVTGTVAYRQVGWGTQLATKIAGLPLNTPCQLWVVEGNGTRVQAGSWATDANEGNVWYPGSTLVPATAISSFVIIIQGRQPVTISPT